MIKDVHINNPDPFLGAIEFHVDTGDTRRADTSARLLEAVVA
jgi:hypothetical protein